MFSGRWREVDEPSYHTMCANELHTKTQRVLRILSTAENMGPWPNVGILLAHRLRRWPDSKPALGQILMFVG